MRLRTFLALILLSLSLPTPLRAGVTVSVSVDTAKIGPDIAKGNSDGKSAEVNEVNNYYSSQVPEKNSRRDPGINEAIVEKMNGTIMVQHPDGFAPSALSTGSAVEKGDIITVYDQSWVILKTRKGCHLGFDGYTGPTVVTIDELYIDGPDRQIRLILQKGTINLRTGGSGSQQSFFEINTGAVVTSINNSEATIHYDPTDNSLKVQYLEGKVTVIDKNNEQVMNVQHTEHSWKNGAMLEVEPQPMYELDVVNYHKFFDCDPRLLPEDNNILLHK